MFLAADFGMGEPLVFLTQGLLRFEAAVEFALSRRCCSKAASVRKCFPQPHAITEVPAADFMVLMMIYRWWYDGRKCAEGIVGRPELVFNS